MAIGARLPKDTTAMPRIIQSPLWLGRFNTMEEARAAFRARGQAIGRELRFPDVDPMLVRFLSEDGSVTGVADVRELAGPEIGRAPPNR